jgi:hypothetical protein
MGIGINRGASLLIGREYYFGAGEFGYVMPYLVELPITSQTVIKRGWVA